MSKEQDLAAQIEKLINYWRRKSNCDFKSASNKEVDMERRAIEYGATIFFNCANQLELLIQTGELPKL